MPKQRITKEMVVEAAFALAREGGMEQVLVKNIAKKLHCSVQPIYSYCRSMEGLRRLVEDRAAACVYEYAASRQDPADRFRSTGLAYIHLAKEEPQLYRLFFFRHQEGVASLEGLYRQSATAGLAEGISKELGISVEQARALHLHMILYSMGLGFLLASAATGISEEEAAGQLEAAYRSFLSQAKRGEL